MKQKPLTLLTGFLGSGKSTLINRIMKDLPEVKFGLIVNEFGDVKLESQIVEAQDGDIMELSNGCMCCVIRTDLIQTVRGFLDQKPEVEHLLVEASGLSDPLPIAQTFVADDLEGRLRFDSVITVVDVLNFSSNIKDFQVAINQLKYSDFVILTKTELTSTKAVDEVKNLVKALSPKAVVYDHREKELFKLVLDTADLDHQRLTNLKYTEVSPITKPSISQPRKGKKPGFKEIHKVKHEKVETLFYQQDLPMDYAKIGKVLDSLPDSVVRAKGFIYLNTQESAQLKVIFQSVAKRNSLDVKPWKSEEKKFTAMVFIGKNFNTQELKNRLDESVAFA